MEKTFRILKNKIYLQNGEQITIQDEIGKTTLEQLQKDLEMCIQQRDRMQELVDMVNHKIELCNNAGENDYIIL